jgi:hypothetical protein
MNVGAFDAEDAAAVRAGRATFDAAAAKACIDGWSQIPCSDKSVIIWPPTACSRVLVGRVALGGACYGTRDCAGGRCDATTACPGVCVAAPVPGDACSGVFCDGASRLLCVAGRCATEGGVGAACDDRLDCEQGLACLSSACATAMEAGGACSRNDDCAEGLYCLLPGSGGGGGGGVCTPQVARGGTCREDQAHVGALGQCALGLGCAGSVYDAVSGRITPGTCEPAVDAGGACSAVATWNGCLPHLACVGGVCVVPPTSGPCGSDPAARCTSGEAYCDATTQQCLPTKAAGAACASGAECQSEQCLANACAPLRAPNCLEP